MRAWARAGSARDAPPPGGLPSGRRGSGTWAPRPNPPRAVPATGALTSVPAAPTETARLPFGLHTRSSGAHATCSPTGSGRLPRSPPPPRPGPRRRTVTSARPAGLRHRRAPGAGESAVGGRESARVPLRSVGQPAAGRGHRAQQPVFRGLPRGLNAFDLFLLCGSLTFSRGGRDTP